MERLHGQVIKISPTSTNYINPMDLNLDYSDDESPVAKDKELRDRLDYELGIINQLKFPSYFLITADFINWAKDHDLSLIHI